MELRLPADKLQRVKESVQEWLGKDSGRKKDINSLVGLLQHASTVVKPGRRFVRRIIEEMAKVRNRNHLVRFNQEIISDLLWWHKFLEQWNGIGMLPDVENRTVKLYSDASGSWGCAAVFKDQWFQWQWSHQACSWHIAPKKLLPIVLAMLMWGEELVVCNCDNSSVVEVLNNGYSRDPVMMHIMRCLFFISEYYHLSLEAVHLPGKNNVAADALSRNNLPLFFQVSPEARPDPSPIPSQALRLLVEEQPDWTSTNWTRLFVACTRPA